MAQDNIEINGKIHLNGFSENSEKINGHTYENGINSKPSKFEIPTAKLKEIVVTDYIQESLDKVARAEGFRNYEIKIDHGSSFGDGFVGVLIKAKIQELDIHYRHKRRTLLVKTPPQSEMRRQAMNSMPLFKREVYMYNVFLPELVKFQEDFRIHKEKGFYNFPKIYFAEYSEERDDAIIIMEDLRENNFNMWDKSKPMNFEHANLVVSSLGRLHGLSLAMKIKKPETFKKFKEIDDLMLKIAETSENAFFDHGKYLEMNVMKAIESLDPNDIKKKQRAIKLLDGLMEQMRPCLSGSAAEPFSVVTHGDCWTNNFLFHYGKRGVPKEINLIDWQVSRYCSPAIDLVYFLFICTDRELRAKHWDELINIYHRSVKEILEHVGIDTMTQFPITALLRQLKKFGKFGVIMGSMLVPMLLTKNEELMDIDFVAEKMKDMDPAMIAEVQKQFEAHSAASATRLREIIEDAIQYGYL